MLNILGAAGYIGRVQRGGEGRAGQVNLHNRDIYYENYYGGGEGGGVD